MKAAIGRPSREEHDKNPCIVCPSILGGIFRPAPASSRRPNLNPAAAAGGRVAGAAPGRAQLRSLPAGVVATESLSCLCILGHRLRFDIGPGRSCGPAGARRSPGRVRVGRRTPGPDSDSLPVSCLCILRHRLRFDVGFAVSHGHSRDRVTGPGAASETARAAGGRQPVTQVQVPVAS